MIDDTHLKITLDLGKVTGSDSQHSVGDPNGPVVGHEFESYSCYAELLKITAL